MSFRVRHSEVRKINNYKDLLIEQALAAKKHAYVPYSQYPVGAAVMTADGQVFSGCNIENASYGLSICAERTAIFNAISSGHRDFSAMAVAVDGTVAASPCGACRQVISELLNSQATIYLVNSAGEGTETTIEDLLPGAFSKDYM